MNPDQHTPFDFAEDAATRRDLGLPFDGALETDSLEELGAVEARPRRRSRRPRKPTSTLRRLLLSIVVLAVTAAIAGLATYSTFSANTNAGETITSGTVAVTLGATGAKTNRLNIAATGMAPGDVMNRTVDVIKGTNTIALAGVTLTTNATTSSALDSNATDGLQVSIDTCSLAAGWTEAGVAPAYTYTCPGGTISTVLASRQVIGSNITLSNMNLTATGGTVATDHLLVKLTLPTTGGNAFQGITSTINFQFTETQRAGTNV